VLRVQGHAKKRFLRTPERLKIGKIL